MTETTVQKLVHVTYSPSASMNYHWTINLHDGNPPLQVLLPEEYILSSLHNFCNLSQPCFNLVMITFVTPKGKVPKPELQFWYWQWQIGENHLL